MMALGYAGANVTMPYKTIALKYLDELTPTAALMGAVNTVEFKDGKMIGHNTDGLGLLEVLEATGVDLPGAKMVVLGAGGAGSAVFVAATIKGVKHLKVFNANDQFFEPTRKHLAHISEETGATI